MRNILQPALVSTFPAQNLKLSGSSVDCVSFIPATLAAASAFLLLALLSRKRSNDIILDVCKRLLAHRLFLNDSAQAEIQEVNIKDTAPYKVLRILCSSTLLGLSAFELVVVQIQQQSILISLVCFYVSRSPLQGVEELMCLSACEDIRDHPVNYLFHRSNSQMARSLHATCHLFLYCRIFHLCVPHD